MYAIKNIIHNNYTVLDSVSEKEITFREDEIIHLASQGKYIAGLIVNVGYTHYNDYLVTRKTKDGKINFKIVMLSDTHAVFEGKDKIYVYKEYTGEIASVPKKKGFTVKNVGVLLHPPTDNLHIQVVYKDKATKQEYVSTYLTQNKFSYSVISDLVPEEPKPKQNSFKTVVDAFVSASNRHDRAKMKALYSKLGNHLDMKVLSADMFDRTTIDIMGNRYGDSVHYRLNTNTLQIYEK
jgi:hypothetical protein